MAATILTSRTLTGTKPNELPVGHYSEILDFIFLLMIDLRDPKDHFLLKVLVPPEIWFI